MSSFVASLDRRLLVGVGVVTVVAVLVLVVRPLLLGGGDDGELEQLQIGAAAEPAEPAPTEEPTEEPELVPETFEVFSARDPFQQLVPAAPAEGDGSTTATVSSADTTAAPESSEGGDASAQPSTTSESTADASPAAVGATEVQLVEAAPGDELVVSVNGTSHRAAAGEVFAERFRVLDVDGACASLLFGDSRFSLCEGESITK